MVLYYIAKLVVFFLAGEALDRVTFASEIYDIDEKLLFTKFFSLVLLWGFSVDDYSFCLGKTSYLFFIIGLSLFRLITLSHLQKEVPKEVFLNKGVADAQCIYFMLTLMIPPFFYNDALNSSFKKAIIFTYLFNLGMIFYYKYKGKISFELPQIFWDNYLFLYIIELGVEYFTVTLVADTIPSAMVIETTELLFLAINCHFKSKLNYKNIYKGWTLEELKYKGTYLFLTLTLVYIQQFRYLSIVSLMVSHFAEIFAFWIMLALYNSEIEPPVKVR